MNGDGKVDVADIVKILILSSLLIRCKLAANIWPDVQEPHTRRGAVGEAAKQAKARKLFGTVSVNVAGIRWKANALIRGGLRGEP